MERRWRKKIKTIFSAFFGKIVEKIIQFFSAVFGKMVEKINSNLFSPPFSRKNNSGFFFLPFTTAPSYNYDVSMSSMKYLNINCFTSVLKPGGSLHNIWTRIKHFCLSASSQRNGKDVTKHVWIIWPLIMGISSYLFIFIFYVLYYFIFKT